MEALINIQKELKAPKSQYNSFGKYNYRNAEDILEAVKPLLAKYKATMYISDEIVEVGGRIYVKATVRFQDNGTNSVSVSAYAREPETLKGMSDSQVTGTASSYARKYALNALFLIDDTKDCDTNELREESKARDDYQKKTEQNKTEQKKPASKFSNEQLEQMKKWAIGEVFTSDELADVKKKLCGANWETVFAETQEEYQRRISTF